MLSQSDNEMLCGVGPGTAMGDVMRQYWIPAFLSKELPNHDSDPMRLRLLGEDLIAFRDTGGRLGLLANSCAHRGASLFYGRNEDNGLRCVYHGWKYDVTGQCVDMPNEPDESNFKDKIRQKAYATQERNGIVWAYLGPRQAPDLPGLPDLESNMVDPEATEIWTAMRNCNYMQALEGDIDTSHLGFLHLGAIRPDEAPPKSFNYYTVSDKKPRYHVMDTDAGTMYAAYRPAEEDTYYYRFAQFLMPCFTMIPTNSLGTQIIFRAWVPLDDNHTMFWAVSASTNRAELKNSSFRQAFAGTSRGPVYLENTSGWLGRWRLANDATNDYGLDRDVQRAGKSSGILGSYTGIDGIHLQDQAITESMGTVYQRNQEHLGASDAMVIKTRRRLLSAARALRDYGTQPPGADDPAAYRVRSGGTILPRNADWLEATSTVRKAFTS
jgi:phenylpropionate dioxygenase-like ring-hydroxylating dioxygenase large terminal subunit